MKDNVLTQPSVGVLLFQDNKVLLVKTQKPHLDLNEVWEIPGGHIEKGEDEKAAAVRELLEETGLLADEKELEEFPGNILSEEIQNKTDESFIYPLKVFLCRTYSGSLRLTNETSPKWIEIFKLNMLCVLPSVQDIIEKGQKYYES